MGYRRLIPLILGQAALFGCGVWAVFALHHDFYANLVLSLMTAAWIAAATVALAMDGSRPRTWFAGAAAAARQQGPARWRALVDQSPAPMVAGHLTAPCARSTRPRAPCFTPMTASSIRPLICAWAWRRPGVMIAEP